MNGSHKLAPHNTSFIFGDGGPPPFTPIVMPPPANSGAQSAKATESAQSTGPESEAQNEVAPKAQSQAKSTGVT